MKPSNFSQSSSSPSSLLELSHAVGIALGGHRGVLNDLGRSRRRRRGRCPLAAAVLRLRVVVRVLGQVGDEGRGRPRGRRFGLFKVLFDRDVAVGRGGRLRRHFVRRGRGSAVLRVHRNFTTR